MSVTYATALKSTRMSAVVTAIGETGYLVIGTSALAGGATGVLVKMPMSAIAGTVTNEVLTLNAVTTTAAAAGGTAALAEIRSSSADTGNLVVSGLTVGTSGADINLNTVTIGAGADVSLTGTNTISHG